MQYIGGYPFEVMWTIIQQTNLVESRAAVCHKIKKSPFKNYIASKQMILDNK